MICDHWEGDDAKFCGQPTDRRYLSGPRCPLHTPAAIAGRPDITPDPALTLTGLMNRRPNQTEAAAA